MDGLLDVIDARASHGETEKKLEILKDPHTGAFAIIGCGVYLLVYLAAFQEMRPQMIPAYCMIFIVTRASAVWPWSLFPWQRRAVWRRPFPAPPIKRRWAL